MSDRNGGRSFFGTLPGIFTGLASVIGAFSALYVALHTNEPENAAQSQNTRAPLAAVSTTEPARKPSVATPSPLPAARTEPAKTTPAPVRETTPRRESRPDAESRRVSDSRVRSSDRRPAVREVGGEWHFHEAWTLGELTCYVSGTYQLSQDYTDVEGRYRQSSDCSEDSSGIVAEGQIDGDMIEFFVPNGDGSVCYYEGILIGNPAYEMSGTAACANDDDVFALGEWEATR